MACAAWLPATAQASFGIDGFDAAVSESDGSPDTHAGTHPYEISVHIGFTKAGQYTDGDLRDLTVSLPPGLLANPAALSECSAAQFHTPRVSPHEPSLSGESCPDASQVGVVTVDSAAGARSFGVFNLTAPYGDAEAIGFAPFGVPIVLSAAVREADAGLDLGLENLSQALDLQSFDLTLWGTPWEKSHDGLRGNCLAETSAEPGVFGLCQVADAATFIGSYLTLPSNCGVQLHWQAAARSWQGGQAAAAAAGPPAGLSGCVEPLSRAKVQLRTDSAAAATGLLFNIDVNDGGGFLNPGGIVRSPLRSATVALPEGVTVNPSLGAGLGVCTEADFARESAATAPGAGCPNQSKIGDVAIEGLLGLPEIVAGSVFLAKPYENPSHSLIALYVVASSPRRGLFTKATGRVDPDPRAGRLLVSFEGLPNLHYTHFQLDLREGQRAALISPPACGEYATALQLRPYSDPDEVIPDSSALRILHGEGGGACPSGAARPFAPGLEAGSLNLQAGAYSPFDLRMTRSDAEQEISSYSATFPPGLLGKIAAIPFCPEAAIAAAKARTGPRGGEEELEAPSCPASSQIGHTLAGYGVGGVLAYAPGALYLAGPYHGAPLSTVAIDSALVGPFDLGVVVVRSAIRIDPVSAQVSIDSSGSDPIPHILAGIPLHLRDIRVDVDRSGFTLSPTSCDVLASHSQLSGAGTDLSSPADDVLAGASQRYQLLGCSGLGFRPRLRLELEGGARRGRYPALRAVYTPRPGNANIREAVVALPHTEFLAQSHIREICTLHQFQAQSCPPSSIYGHAKAFTPLLGEPLQGPVYLRSSSAHPLPDLVVALRSAGGIAIDLSGRVDSTKAGGLRASFEALPDAPVSKFVLTLRAGKKGLLENSANLCGAPSFASARFIAHSNQTEALAVAVKPDCRHPHRKHRR